jgi:hypothetical protein
MIPPRSLCRNPCQAIFDQDFRADFLSRIFDQAVCDQTFLTRAFDQGFLTTPVFDQEFSRRRGLPRNPGGCCLLAATASMWPRRGNQNPPLDGLRTLIRGQSKFRRPVLELVRPVPHIGWA